MEGGAALKLLTLSRLSFTCMHLELQVSSKVGVLFRRLLGLMLDTHMFFVRPVFPLAAWEVLVPQISPATFHPQPQVLVGAHPPAISQGACFILRLQLIACCAGHTEQNLHGFRTTASDWQQCENCELELEHRRVMHAVAHLQGIIKNIYVCSCSSSSTSLFEILYFVLEMGKLPRRNGQPVLPWMQCQGCKAWFKNAKKITGFNKFGTTYCYCDNCWMYWDNYNCWMYWDNCNYYYYHWYPQCLQAVKNCSN